MDLSGKVALVTGSSRGIGRAIAIRLAQAGATVALNSTKDASETHRLITEAGGKASVHIADVRKSDEVNKMVDDIVAAHGGLDILVNNAGINKDTLLIRMSDADWESVMSTNLSGAFYCTRAAVKGMMKKRYGRVVNVGSIIGIKGNPGQANYASAKAGLEGLTKTTALEFASRGITANLVAPGFIETEMTAKISPERQEALKAHIPVGQFGKPEQVAEAVAFLASNEAAYITGQVLVVDGGITML